MAKARQDKYTGENQPTREKESWKRFCDAAFRTSKRFQRSMQKLYFHFFLLQASLKM